MVRAAALLVLLFVGVLFLTNPQGDFPLNDDWSYGTAVKNLVERGEYRPADWTSMTLFTQVLWGALFSLPAGFSFTALRFSTLVLSLLGLYLLLLLARVPRSPLLTPHSSLLSPPSSLVPPPSSVLHPRSSLLPLLAPLLLLANPVYLGLSHTFMTDVPFIAFTLGALLLLTRGAENGSRLQLGLGVLLALMAALLRQTGMLIPFAFGIGHLARGRISLRKVVLVAGFCLLTVLAYVAYTRWLVATGRLPGSYLAQWSHVLGLLRSGPAGVAKQATSSLLVTYVYLGLFTLPLGLLFVGGASRPRLLVLLALSAVLLAAARLLPVHFAGNILSDRGVGPFTLAHSAGFGAFIGSPVSVALLGLLALVGGALLIEMLLRSIREIRLSLLGAVCLSLAALYFISVALVTQLDRYMLPYLPLLAIPALRHLHRKPPAKPALVAALTLTLAYAAFAVAAVHDYMSWNRVRWQAIGYLTDDLKVPVDQIDGGFEFNGLYARPGDRVHTPGSKPWQYKATEYVVAFDVLDGYVLTADFPVRTWLPAGVKRICLLKRHGPGLDTVP